jgi:hypothetical protein
LTKINGIQAPPLLRQAQQPSRAAFICAIIFT